MYTCNQVQLQESIYIIQENSGAGITYKSSCSFYFNHWQEQVEEMKKKEERMEKQMNEIMAENKRLTEPLQKAREEVEELRKQVRNHWISSIITGHKWPANAHTDFPSTVLTQWQQLYITQISDNMF